MMKFNTRPTKLSQKIETMKMMHSARKINLYKFNPKLEKAERLMKVDYQR